MKKFAYLLILPVVRALISGGTPALYELAAVIIVNELALMRWYNSFYTFDGQILVLHYGIIFRCRKQIPVQALSCVCLDGSVFAHIFGCVKCSVKAVSSGTSADACIYISTDEARSIFGSWGNMKRIPARCVLIKSLFGSNIILGLVTVIPIITQAGKLLGSQVQNGIIFGLTLGQSYLLKYFPPVYAFLITVVIASLFVSFAVSLIKNANLMVWTGDGKIVSSRGLIFQHIKIIYAGKIESIRIRSTLPMRIFGISSLEYGAAGTMRKKGERDVIIPAAPRETVHNAANVCGLKRQKLTVKAEKKYIYKFYLNSSLVFICTLIPVAAAGIIIPDLFGICAAAAIYPSSKAAASVLFSYSRWQKSGVSSDMTYLSRIKGASEEHIFLNPYFISSYRFKTPRNLFRRSLPPFSHVYFHISEIHPKSVKLKYLSFPPDFTGPELFYKK